MAEVDYSDQRPLDAPSEIETATPDRNWLGLASFATGALLLSVVAIILGHLGVVAAKRGRADNRSFSIAGLVLGYAGLIATAVGVLLLWSNPVTAGDVDAKAQQDITAVGAAAAALAAQTGELPEVEQAGAGYRVGEETVPAQMSGGRSLVLTGSSATDWCVTLGYKGGDHPSYHYAATTGMAPGPCPNTN